MDIVWAIPGHHWLTHWSLGDVDVILNIMLFKLKSRAEFLSISCEIALRWMPQDFTDDKSTLVQVMAWCRQATSHYLSQCWHRSLLPYGVTRPLWVMVMAGSLLSTKPLLESMLIPGSSTTECVQTKCNKFQWNMNSNTNQYFSPYINKWKFW